MARSRAPLNRLAAASLLLVGVGAAAVVWLGDDDPPAPSSAYQIAYAVEDLATGTRTTELLEVDRPRVSRRMLDGGGSATTASGVYDRSPEGRWRQLAVVPPGEVGPDLQLTAALTWAGAQGLAAQDGGATVAGRRCTWWLTREPLDLNAFAPATARDRTRSCVGDDGLLLADTWRADGRDLRRRTATAVRALPSVVAFDGSTPDPIDPRLVTTVVQPLQRPERDLVQPAPPPGAELLHAVRSVDVTPGTTDVVRRTQRTVYLQAGVLVVLDQVQETAGPPTPRGDRDVALGRLGTGRVRATGGGLVVEVRVADGLLRVRSGWDLAPLAAWLGDLQVAGA